SGRLDGHVALARAAVEQTPPCCEGFPLGCACVARRGAFLPLGTAAGSDYPSQMEPVLQRDPFAMCDRRREPRGPAHGALIQRLGWEQLAGVWVFVPYSPSTSPGTSMHRSSMYKLLQAATFALPNEHPVVDVLNRASSSGLAEDMIRAKDAVTALLNHD